MTDQTKSPTAPRPTDVHQNPSRDPNRDPISGTHGAHPVGVGVGSVGVGAAAGAAGGAIAGPVGAVVGAAVGAVVGGLAGKAAAEAIDPTIESKYWHDNHASRPFAIASYTYEEFAPAYQYGWESYSRPSNKGKSFEHVEAELGRGWDKAKGTSRLGWDHAKAATHEAWDRVKNAASALAGESQTSCATKGAAGSCTSREPAAATKHA